MYYRFVAHLWFVAPAIVYIHTSSYDGFWINAIFLIISKLFRKKIVLHIHGGGFKNFYSSRPLIIKKLIIKLLCLPNLLFVLSESWYNFFYHITGKKNIVVINNGLSKNFIKHFNENKISNKTILFLGHITKRKGVIDLLQAYQEIWNKDKDFQLMLAGPLLDRQVEKTINDLKNKFPDMAATIKLPGSVFGMKKIELLKKADIFVLPSYAEGLPFVLLEAMAARLPIIATNVGGVPELLDYGKVGLLNEAGDVDGLKFKLQELISNLPYIKKLGARGQNKIYKDFLIENTAQKINKLFLSIN